ncbi:histidine kinase dimerization/phosphoacceptor domain -containing protein [Catalinimonas niigatensis]
MHHCVKNNMQNIIILLSSQAASLQDKATLSDIQNN